MTNSSLSLVILGMAVVTIAARSLPLVFWDKKKFPKWLVRLLNYIPITVISALIASQVFFDMQPHEGDIVNLYFIGALLTFVAAYFTQNFLFTICSGIASISILRVFLSMLGIQ